MHKLPFKTKIVTKESENELYWFKRKKPKWAKWVIERKKGTAFWA
jgi:hypothetical protein